MSQANPLWKAPRIHGELLKLGIEVAESTVGKYLLHRRKPPPQTWRAFLSNHLAQIAPMDFFTVPTATFRVLFVFVVLSHARRRIAHCAVTEHPTQEWTLQRLREAFPWNQSPQYLLRDRDAIYGEHLVAVIQGMGIEEVRTAPRSPWQNPYVERLVGSIRRECLDHIIVWNQRSLRRILQSYFHTTSTRARTWRWPRIRQNREPWKRRGKAASYPFLKSAACTVATGDRLLRNRRKIRRPDLRVLSSLLTLNIELCATPLDSPHLVHDKSPLVQLSFAPRPSAVLPTQPPLRSLVVTGSRAESYGSIGRAQW